MKISKMKTENIAVTGKRDATTVINMKWMIHAWIITTRVSLI